MEKRNLLILSAVVSVFFISGYSVGKSTLQVPTNILLEDQLQILSAVKQELKDNNTENAELALNIAISGKIVASNLLRATPLLAPPVIQDELSKIDELVNQGVSSDGK